MGDTARSFDDFFRHVVDMIPIELYKPPMEGDEDDDEDNVIAKIHESKYYKHRKLPLAPSERKIISMERIKEKYAVKEIPSIATRESTEASTGGGVEEEEDVNEVSGKSSLDMLRMRLQEKILGFKQGRLAKKKADREKKQPEKKGVSKASTNQKQQKKERDRSSDAADEHAELLDLALSVDMSSKRASKREKEVPTDAGGLDLSMPEIFDPTAKKHELAGKPGTKTKRLQRLLEDAEKKRTRLIELKSQGEEGKNRAKEELWIDALKEASGEKVYGNTAEIRKALKKREKRKERSAVQWKERTDKVDSDLHTKIAKREGNILKRKNIKAAGPIAVEEEGKEKRPRLAMVMKNAADEKGKEGKDGKVDKPRPGFEGKKVGLLNKKKHDK